MKTSTFYRREHSAVDHNGRCVQCRAKCEAHGNYDCSCCHRHTDECDFGGCHNLAVTVVNAYRHGQDLPCEVRPACAVHAVDMSALDRRAGFRSTIGVTS